MLAAYQGIANALFQLAENVGVDLLARRLGWQHHTQVR
jgi:hypothetical protein